MSLDEEILRIRELSTPKAIKEIHEKVRPLSYKKSVTWYKLYNDYLSDREAFRKINASEHYTGNKDGYFPFDVKAKLQLLSYYTLGYGDKK